jgi:NAD(P)-dependent dehydrogenase (short-subunit alcohol dehydrogenase family)
MRFSDKVCIVTGAGSGIGKATAIQMAAEGGKIVVVGHSVENSNDTVDAIIKAGGEAIFTKADVSDAAQIKACIDATVEKWGRIDVIVNDAAIMTFDKLIDLSVDDWDKVMNVNLRAVFLYTKYGVPHMPSGSAFVNVSSVHAHATTANVIPYASTKGAMEAFVKGASQEYADKGIRFNCVAPGSVDTPMLWDNPNIKDGKEKLTGVVGKPAELAAAICFMASAEASFINGTTLVADGGKLAILS